MKVLVGPKKPIDWAEFCWTEPGEILWQNPVVCCSRASCGCDRGMSGADTHKNTTVAEVAERDLTDDDVYDLAGKIGRATKFGGEIILPCLKGAIEGAAQFEVGDLVETKWTPTGRDSGFWRYRKVTPEEIAEARKLIEEEAKSP